MTSSVPVPASASTPGAGTVIPCKRPKVTVDPHATAAGAYSATCHVPGCDWAYGTRPYQAVKSDAEQQATRHRAEHRAAVPSVAVVRSHGAEPYHVECMGCGFLRCDGTTTTRTDAEMVRDHHLSSEHGLVTCS